MAGRIHKKLTGLVGLLTLLLFVLSAARCDNEKPFASQNVTFIIPTIIQPMDSVVSIGDTLWISIEQPDSLFDFHTKHKYKLANFDFGQTSVVFRKLGDKEKNLADQLSAGGFFKFIDDSNLITFPGETFVDIKIPYNSMTQKYMFNLGVIPKEKGVYCLQLLSASDLNYNGVVDLGKSAEGATIIPVYNYIYFPINNGANNYNVFKRFCFSTYNDPNDYISFYSEYLGTFTFKVIN